MKYIYLILSLLLLASCHHSLYTDINGTVNGLTYGTVIVLDGDNNNVVTANLEGGKFHIRQILPAMGFYRLRIISDEPRSHRRLGYDVYLEPGNYTVNAVPEEQLQYPVITSTSETQNELSAYYTIANKQSANSRRQIASINNLGNNAQLSHTQDTQESLNLDSAMRTYDKDMLSALDAYVGQNPKNHVSAHLMYQLNYDYYPGVSYPIYKKFTAEDKKSAEGSEEGDKLSALQNFKAGNTAPPLTGNTLDGKPFDPKSIHKKMILVEFWRADDDVSRANHKNLEGQSSPLKDKNITMVSFSLDTSRSVWADAVKRDKMDWLQVSDLKGSLSPNVNNWQAKTIPSYCLVDNNWKIIKTNVLLVEIPEVVDKYLKKHN